MDQGTCLQALTRRIALAKGEIRAEVLLQNARLVNVLSGEIHAADIALADGLVVGFGDYEAETVVDCAGRYVCPGLIDGHIHVESTMLAPWEFARIAAARGTSAVIWDPHEIANVLGRDGIEDMLELTLKCPLSFYIMASSCVPATGMETSGARISPRDISWLSTHYPGRVLGLAEMMNYPGVLGKDPMVLAKIAACGCALVDGHSPLVSGKDLNAYITAGPSTDHECIDLEEAREKLSKGMHIFLREGSIEKNLRDLLPAVTDFNAQNFSLVCDDRDPMDLLTLGHLDHNVRMAISLGVPPVRAIQMASINPARHFGLHRRGAVAPGYRADVVILDDLEDFRVWKAYLAGAEVANTDFTAPGAMPARNTMRLAMRGGRLLDGDFAIPKVTDEVRCIGIVPGQLVTRQLRLHPRLENSRAVADPSRDMAKLAVIERHGKNGNIGLAFVQGLGLVRGAIAGTVAHDSHNLIVAGMNDRDMAVAANSLVECGGGLAVAADGEVLAKLALPVAGLMSLHPAEAVVRGVRELYDAFKRVAHDPEKDTHPFMSLSFLALPVIPSLKLTDRGLVDVERFEHVGLWV